MKKALPILLLSTDGKKYAGLMLSILENSFPFGNLRKIACVLAPNVNNGRHSYLFLTQQAGICETQARRENGTQAQSTVYAQSYEDCTTRPRTGKPTMSSCH